MVLVKATRAASPGTGVTFLVSGRGGHGAPTASTFSMPLQQSASKHVGRVLTDIGGAGLEIHTIRE
ncbi:hypothetical protein [Halorhabdus salina]|uniref:hypothetical protein n=1 Tax=Halorhabdus salina TaxID=2750670 RepID=UPI0015EEAD2B|nr:hypothetical protein [Halorhabdus salina]